MSAGISLMYKKSGGCVIMKRCATCGHLGQDETKRGFSKRTDISYYCGKHPDKAIGWKPGYTACRYYVEAEVYPAYIENQDGQLSFL